ncbi:putative tail protein [Salmonella phage vB_SenP_UTK0002]|nr:putative tail protein [Salmonella phage vB_SenP_UTK0002]
MAVVIEPITNEDLTTKVVDGTGIFDELMTAANAHLSAQWDMERITGTQYAEVYLGQLTAVLQQAVTFLIEKDKTYLNNLLINAQIELANKQIELADKELEKADKEIELLDKQIELQELNKELIAQKVKTEKAQISDTVDSVPVTGIIGAQIALYKQQKDGFIRDAEQKALKIISDTWITRKTVDDGTPLPTGFDTAAVDAFTRKVADGVSVNY